MEVEKMKATPTSVEEKYYFDDPKHPVKVWVVRYKTDQGTAGSVEVPDQSATKETILAAVKADAERVHDVIGMST
jgi:hypothetical protein